MKAQLSLCLGLMMTLSACSMGPTQPVDETLPAMQSYGSKLNNRVALVSAVRQAHGDMPGAQFKLQNTWHSALNLQYKVIWQNSQGMDLDPEASPWLPVFLEPKQIKSIQSVAPNPSAEQYRIELKSQ